MINLIKLRLKILMNNKILFFVLMLVLIGVSLFTSSIFTDYENINSIPVCIIDNDRSEISNSFLKNLADNSSLRFIESDQPDKLLKSNRIECIITIKEGFGKSIESRKIDEIIKLTYLDKSSVAPALSDIIGSSIITIITPISSRDTALRVTRDENIADKTMNDTRDFIDNNAFKLDIITELKTPTYEGSLEIDISKLLPIKMNLGYSLIIITLFIAFILGNTINEIKSEAFNRMIISGVTPSEYFISLIIAMIILITPVILVIETVLFVKFVPFNPLGMLSTYGTIVLFVVLMCSVILSIISIVDNRIRYQNIIAPIIVLMGIVGGAFWSLDLLPDSFSFISMISPFYWFLETIVDILIFGKLYYSPWMILYVVSVTTFFLALSILVSSMNIERGK